MTAIKLKTIQQGRVTLKIEEGGLFDRYRLLPDIHAIQKSHNIPDVSYFEGIKKQPFDHGPMGAMPFPIFYYDMGLFQAVYTADLKALQKLLPTSQIKPLSIFPGRGMIAFTAFEYRVSDVDSYNEIAISVVVAKPYTTSFGFLTLMANLIRKENWTYVWQLPVTTDLACTGGRMGYNYPKFLARIDYVKLANHDECTLFDDTEKKVLTLKGRHLPTKRQKPVINHGLCYKDGQILDVAVKQNPIQIASSDNKNCFQFELGQGPIADTLRGLGIGKMLHYDYAPVLQTQLCAGQVILP